MARTTKIWKLAATTPRDGVFDKGELLIQYAQEFFEWCDVTPRYRTEVVKHKMEWNTIEIEMRRPYTLSGMCSYLGVTQGYFRAVKHDIKEKVESGTVNEEEIGVLAAIEWIEQIVFTDQIEGAATGEYNANLMSRINGLADNVNNATTMSPTLRIITRDAETAANLNLLTAGL